MARTYSAGSPELDAAINELVRLAVEDTGHDLNTELLEEMMATVVRLNRDRADRGDLRLMNASLKEIRYAFSVFAQYRHIRKLAVFGSARLGPTDSNYQLASELGAHMVQQRGWMVVTGAGPGIMEAANRGAGPDNSFGVNIRLPFEDSANGFIDPSRIINFNYFFPRKLVFVKESDAFALFPGGFGTQDEVFELLTLTQTGKSSLHPIVLIEAPGRGYWDPWIDFVHTSLVEKGMISPDDLNLVTRVDSVEGAADVICDFFRNYHSQRFVDGALILRMQHPIDADGIARLNDEFGDLVSEGRIEAVTATEAEIADDDHIHLPRLRLRFDRRSLGRLRSMVDTINELAPGEAEAAGD